MSRPFSYNDENFTVIGNILFVHVELGGNSYKVGDTLCTIPYAIFARMTTYNQAAFVASKRIDRSGLDIGITCKKDARLITWSSIGAENTSPRFLLTWYYLKDI